MNKKKRGVLNISIQNIPCRSKYDTPDFKLKLGHLTLFTSVSCTVKKSYL
jgi:hypothetical protein